MGRSKVAPLQQPTDESCGPSALKMALEILGKRRSIESLIELCKTNKNGTSTKNLIEAINKLGFSALLIEYATLRHVQSALKCKPDQMRAAMVTYLYDTDKNQKHDIDSGHWAVVCSYSASKGRVVLLDSASAKKKSYAWSEFRERWKDFDLKRRRVSGEERKFKLVKKWQPQLLLVIAREDSHLPKFKIPTKQLYSAVNPN